MGIEIDFLPVGLESKSGDAIALRYGDLHGSRDNQTIVVFDGGFSDDGAALVKHIKDYYGTDRVDIVISTHPDHDHVAGLSTVLEELTVGELWLHQPWRHSVEMSNAHKSAIARTRLSEVAKASLQDAEDLEQIAARRGITVREPFAGLATADGALTILGPSQSYYEELLPAIDADSRQAAAASLAEIIKRAAKAAVSWVGETLHIETLTDEGSTSPTNNTSVITRVVVDGRTHVLTGDAGMPAIEKALNALEADGFTAGSASFVQVPHHGSRRNIGPTVLDRLLGAKGQSESRGTAFVSAAVKGEPKHPSKKVVNAFTRRGYKVVATQGASKVHHHDAPNRPTWVTADPLPFYDQVEDDED